MNNIIILSYSIINIHLINCNHQEAQNHLESLENYSEIAWKSLKITEQLLGNHLESLGNLLKINFYIVIR
jgi:hypothetical protein